MISTISEPVSTITEPAAPDFKMEYHVPEGPDQNVNHRLLSAEQGRLDIAGTLSLHITPDTVDSLIDHLTDLRMEMVKEAQAVERATQDADFFSSDREDL